MSTKNTKNKDVLNLNFKPLKKILQQRGSIDWTIKLYPSYYYIDNNSLMEELNDNINYHFHDDIAMYYYDDYANGKGFLPFDQPEFETIILDFVEALKTFIENNYTYTEDDSVPIIFRFVKNDIVIKNTVHHYYNTYIDNDNDKVTIVGPYFEFDGEHNEAEDSEFNNDYCNNSWVADSTDLAGLVRYILKYVSHLITDESDFIDNSKFDTAAELIATLRKNFMTANSDCNYKIEFIDN